MGFTAQRRCMYLSRIVGCRNQMDNAVCLSVTCVTHRCHDNPFREQTNGQQFENHGRARWKIWFTEAAGCCCSQWDDIVANTSHRRADVRSFCDNVCSGRCAFFAFAVMRWTFSANYFHHFGKYCSEECSVSVCHGMASTRHTHTAHAHIHEQHELHDTHSRGIDKFIYAQSFWPKVFW